MSEAPDSSPNVRCRVAVAILNWNGEEHLKRFLPSVVAHTGGDDCVVVIDNGSTDHSLPLLEERFPSVHLVKLEENHGFAGGYNRGLEALLADWEADWVVLLNSDVEVTEGWLDAMVHAATENGWAAAQPKVRAVEKRAEFEYAGAAGGYMDRHGFMFCAGRLFDTRELDTGQYDGNVEVFWASGACLLVSTEAWKSVAGLDEDFFAHMEEIDLCWRLRNRGLTVGMTSTGHVYHLGGGTLQQESPRKAHLNFRNNLFLLLKNDHRPGIRGRIFFRQCLDGVAGLRFLLEGKPDFFKAVIRAHGDFRKSRRIMAAKRGREMASCLPVADRSTSGQYRGSIVWDYFVRGKRLFSELDPNRFG
ncbi:MAG: glycosyltransferase family 2 protein [Flavobacteriales bacterium]